MLKLDLQCLIVYFRLCLSLRAVNQLLHELISIEVDRLVLWANGTFPDLSFSIAFNVCVQVKTLIVVTPLALDWRFHWAH